MVTAPFSLGVTEPKQKITTPASTLDTTSAAPASAGGWYDPAKIAELQAQQGAGNDGRTVLADWSSALTPLTGVSELYGKQDAAIDYGGGSEGGGGNAGGASYEGYAGQYKNAQGNVMKAVSGADYGLDPAGEYFIDNYGNPTGNDGDKVNVVYQRNADGTAAPRWSDIGYKPSKWVDSGRDVAKMAAIAAAAAVGGGWAAGLEAAPAATAMPAFAGNVGGASLGTGATAGSQAGAMAAALAPEAGGLTAAQTAYGALEAGGAAAGMGGNATAAGGFGVGAAGAGAGAGGSMAGALIPGVSNGQLLSAGLGLAGTALNRPPAAPDANQLINTQTAANSQAAQESASINRPDINTPFGSQKWSRVADPSQPGGFRYIQDNTLSAGEQALYDKDTANKIAKQDIAGGLQGAAANAVSKPFDLSGQPAMRTSIASGNDYAAQRDQVTKSVYDQGARLLKPGQDQALESQDAQLRNQGLMPGTQAYDNALAALRQTQLLQMNDLQDRATQAGGTEQSRLAGLDLTSANFGNNARQTSIQEALLQRTQPLAELNSFTSGAAPTTPTFQPFGSSSVAPANTQAASAQQYQGETNSYNARQAQLQSLLNLGTTMYGSKQPQYDPTTGQWVTPS